MDKARYLGIDIGGTKCAVVLGDEKGQILKKLKIDTGAYRDTMEKLISMAEELMIPEVKAIGISCGGPLDIEKGLILSPPNLPDWDNVPIVEIFWEHFGVPVFIRNDADACAVAEWRFGAGKGSRNMIFLTFGTGMGAGLILDGRLYSGTCSMAGEIGHVRLYESGHMGYGKAGAVEGYCSGGGIAQFGLGTAKEVAEKAFQGDPESIEVYARVGRELGRALSILIDVLNPEIIVIGSIYARAKDLIEPHMNSMIDQEALPRSRSVVRIVPAQLGESLGDVAALSVAMLIE